MQRYLWGVLAIAAVPVILLAVAVLGFAVFGLIELAMVH